LSHQIGPKRDQKVVFSVELWTNCSVGNLAKLPASALFATYIQNITTLSCKMANDDKMIRQSTKYKMY